MKNLNLTQVPVAKAEMLIRKPVSAGGFSLVLAGLKAFLEHNILLNLVSDRFAEGLDNPRPIVDANRPDR